jgi:hypothetical protein
MRHFATERARARGSSTRRPRSRASWRRSSASSSARQAGARRSTTRPAAPARCSSRRPTRPTRHHDLRPGDGRRHLGAGAHEHDPARPPTAELWRGNTLAAPHFKNKDGSLKTFDFAVANPPFSAKAWSSGLDPAHDEFKRFEYGVPPAKNGDYAFLLHLIASLKSTGKGAIILPHGVLFRGNKEADIRRTSSSAA